METLIIIILLIAVAVLLYLQFRKKSEKKPTVGIGEDPLERDTKAWQAFLRVLETVMSGAQSIEQQQDFLDKAQPEIDLYKKYYQFKLRLDEIINKHKLGELHY